MMLRVLYIISTERERERAIAGDAPPTFQVGALTRCVRNSGASQCMQMKETPRAVDNGSLVNLFLTWITPNGLFIYSGLFFPSLFFYKDHLKLVLLYKITLRWF